MEEDVRERSGAARLEDLETLRRRVSDSRREAEAVTRVVERTEWILYAAMFFLLPFVVVLFRRHLQAVHYYLAGAAFLALALVTLAVHFKGAAKRDKAAQAVRRAQEACEAARLSARDAATRR